MLSILLSLSLVCSGIAFGLGIALPLVHFEKFYFFSESPSLIELIFGLWAEGDIGISVLVAVFSIISPFMKMLIVFHAATNRSTRSFPRWLSYLSKWSMMDVLLVALIIFGAKTSGIATAVSQPGIWFYASAAVLSVIAAELVYIRRKYSR